LAAQPPTVWKKILKIALWTAVSFAALSVIALGAAAILVPKYFPPAKIKRMVTDQLAAKLHRTIKVKDVSFNVWKGFKITGVSMSNRAGWTNRPFLAADEILASYHLYPILWGSIQLGEIRLEKPVLLVERKGPTDYNFTDMMGASTAPAAAPTASGSSSGGATRILQMLSIGQVTLHQARVTYIDYLSKPTLQVDLPGMDFTVKHISLSGGKSTFQLVTPMVYGGTTYKFDVSGSYKFNYGNQTLRGLEARGAFNDIQFSVAGDADKVVDDFSPAMKGEANLDLAQAWKLLPKAFGPPPKDLSITGPFHMPFTVGGSLKKGLAFDGTADLTGADLAFGDKFKKAKGVPCSLDFKTLTGNDWFKMTDFQAVLGDWALKGSLDLTGLEAYPGDPKAHPAFAFTAASKSLPLKALGSLSPMLKDFTFTGDLGVDLAISASLRNPSSGSLRGGIEFRGLNAVHPKEPKFLEDLTGRVALTDTSILVPDTKFKLMGAPCDFTFSMTRFHVGELVNFGKCNAFITSNFQCASDIDLEKVMAAFPSGPKAGPGPAPATAPPGPPPDLRPNVSPGLTVNAKAHFAGFKYRKIRFAPEDAVLTLSKRVLKFSGAMGGFSGSCAAAFTLDMNKFPHAYAYSLKMANVSAQTAFNDTVDSFVTKNPENYKDKVAGVMTLLNTGGGSLDAAPAKSFHGQGPVTLTGVKFQALAMLGGISEALKNKESAIKMDLLEGTIAIADSKVTLNLKSQGASGKMRIAGSVGFDGQYAPELRIENDIPKDSLDSSAVFAKLPESTRSRVDLNRAADAQGFVPVDFKLTGSVASNPGLKAMDPTRLVKNVAASYTKQVQQKAGAAVQKALGGDVGNKLKKLFGQ